MDKEWTVVIRAVKEKQNWNCEEMSETVSEILDWNPEFKSQTLKRVPVS